MAAEGARHVLIIVENLPVPLDRRVWQEACALRDAGYRVSVICPRMRGWTAGHETRDGIEIHRHWISGEAKGRNGFAAEYATALWGETRLAWKVWRRARFDLIHLCNPPDLPFLVALPFKWLFGVRIVYDVHDAWPEMFEAKFGGRGLLYWSVRLAERLTYAAADVVLATNESVRSVAMRRGRKKPGEVFVVRSSPAGLAAEGTTDETLRKGHRHLVGYIGVMGNTDSVHLLVEAAAEIKRLRGRDDVQFLIMGTGPERRRLIETRERLGLDESVDLPGRVTDEHLATALRTMDLGVSCDPRNPYNDCCTMNKTLEYMACGKAQVMFDLKEGRASAGETAVYVRECHPRALAEAIASLLDQPAKRQEMGTLALRRLRTQLGWERSVEALREAYTLALRRARCSGSRG